MCQPHIQQFGAGKQKPENENNPQPENVGGVQQQDVDNTEGAQQHEVDNELGDENDDYVDRFAFNEKLYARQFKPAGKRDKTMAGKQYKLKIESLIRQHMEKSAVSFFMVYQCKLVKYNNDGEEMESTYVYFHSST